MLWLSFRNKHTKSGISLLLFQWVLELRNPWGKSFNLLPSIVERRSAAGACGGFQLVWRWRRLLSAVIQQPLDKLSHPFLAFKYVLFSLYAWNYVLNRSARLRILAQQRAPFTKVMFTHNICLNYEMPVAKTIDIFNHCIPEKMRKIFQSSYQS